MNPFDTDVGDSNNPFDSESSGDTVVALHCELV